MQINDREFTDEEFATIVQLACDVCGYLQDRVKKPMDALITMTVAAFIMGKGLTQGSGGEHKMSEVMMWLMRDVEEKLAVPVVIDEPFPGKSGDIVPPKA